LSNGRHIAGLLPIITAVVLLALAGCGGDDEPESKDQAGVTPTETAEAETEGSAATALSSRPEGIEGLRVAARRARITVEDSPFGRVLFDANGQVVYVFEIDRRNRSNCTSSECVQAWPPMLTRGEPTAGQGVDAGLLGTIRRSDGKLQVTYNGRPLYFYEHEAPGEIKCHNVNLHGGLWWVVAPDGEPVE
jgi:predicted lipoprotein with Yx(FWY)xxD motif